MKSFGDRKLQATLTSTLLVLMLAGSAFAVDSSTAVAEIGKDGVQRATLILNSYSFAPDRLVIAVGKPVELTLKNAASVTPHDFVLTPKAGLIIKQNVKPGGEAVLRFTPTVPGEFEFYCSKKRLFFASHKAKGMAGTLVVR